MHWALLADVWAGKENCFSKIFHLTGAVSRRVIVPTAPVRLCRLSTRRAIIAQVTFGLFGRKNNETS